MVNQKMKNALSFLTLLGLTLISTLAFASDGAASNDFDLKKCIALASGLGIAIAAFGGALGQGKTASSALDGIARNPSATSKIFMPMILGLALIESLVIYSLLVSLLLLFKI